MRSHLGRGAIAALGLLALTIPALAVEENVHTDSGTPVMGRDSSGNAHFLKTDASGNVSTTATPGTVSHASTTALANSLAVKAAPGTLFGFNCSGVAGAAAGYCIAYNATVAPGGGALTGSLVLDICYFDTTARGCSLARNSPISYSAGIVILVTSATTPFTYTTGTDTAFVSADYQ